MTHEEQRDLFGSVVAPQPDLPPQLRKVCLYAAGGAFVGALLAIIVAKILAGPCCCVQPAPESVGALSTNELVLPG